jgi:hypothetical protein
MASNTGQKARLLVAYYSFTGNTRHIAQALAQRLLDFCDVETVEIIPRRRRCYLHWLAYSFVPDSEVDIENPEMELSHYDVVLLGFPKWTFSCPPLNGFVRKLRSLNKPRFYLFMTCGGFDQQRFLDSFTHKLARIGCDVAGSLTIEREQIHGETYPESVDSFAKYIQAQLR